MSLIDSHCHLDSAEFDPDRDEVIQRALDAGVEHMVAIGTGSGPPDLEAGIRLAEKYPAFYATVGVHPHDAAKATPVDLRRLEELLSRPKVIAVGEIGLDYHYDFSPRETQKSIFIEQMSIAARSRKPIVIHTREAWDDTLALIERHWKPHGLPGIMHCFSGGPAEAQRALDLGFYLSFGGIVTFPKALDVQAVARTAPRAPDSGRNGCALSRACPQAWQTQRTGARRSHGARSWPNCAAKASRALQRPLRKISASSPAPDYAR